MKTIKIIGAVLTCMVLISAAFAGAVIADDPDEHGLTYQLDEETGVLTISYDNNPEHDGIIPNTYAGNPNITKVVIQYGVKGIGYTAFYNCSNITTVEIPGSVASIGEFGFSECFALESVVIPDSVTSIGSSAFSGCDQLVSVTLGNGINSIEERMFSYCSSLPSITIPNNITSIGNNAFAGCNSLTSISIPGSVTSIGEYAFYSCNNLDSVTIEYGVARIEKYAFYWNRNLTSVTIPGSVTSIGDNAFFYCTNLNSLSLGYGITSIGNFAFSYCSSLLSVIIPESLTSIGNSAFAGCTGLTSITIPGSVTSIEPAVFSFCTKLESVSLKNGITNIGSSAFFGCSALVSIDFPESLISIGETAFIKCNSLTSVNIPKNVTRIGDGAFAECENLSSINVNSNNANYSSIDGVLFDKAKTILIVYPPGKTDTTYSIPNTVTRIDSGAFYSCCNLTSINIPESVTSIGTGAFSECDGLLSITIPGSVSNISDMAFSICGNLKSLILGNGITSIGEYAFYYCGNLTSVTIPSSVTKIGYRAFFGCNSLNTVKFATYSHLEEISEGAFSYIPATSGTSSITLPVSNKEGYLFVKWINNYNETVTEITQNNAEEKFHVEWAEPITTPTHSSSTVSFTGEKVGNVFTFTNAVVVKEATLPGASSAKIVNKSGEGWYNFDLTAPGFTGNGSMLFEVPLDVLNVKEFTTNDVGLYHQENGKWVLKPTVLLSKDNNTAYYKATFDSCSPFMINFEKDATATTAVITPVEETTKPVTISISGVSSMKVGDTTVLTAANSDGSSAKYIWKSSDDSIATVDENGNLKAVKAGTATITVTNNVTGKTATKTITVAANAEPAKQQTTKSPFPILGILAGLGVAGVLVMRRKR